MTSPSPRNSPKRRALHERTDSHTNEITSPSLRIVEDPEARIYSSNPYPSQASHVLLPSSGQGLLFEEDEGVSDKITLTKPFASSSPQGRIWKGKGEVIAKTTDVSETGSPSAAHPLPFSPSAPEYTQLRTPATSSPTRQQLRPDLNIDLERRVSDEIIQLPSIAEPGIATCSTNPPESPMAAPPPPDIPLSDKIISKPPKVSNPSSASTETVERPPPRDRSSRVSYSAFPPLERPSSSRSTRSFSTSVAPPHLTIDRSGGFPSHASSSYPSVQGRRTSSVPSHADLQAAINSGANVQYSVVRPPVASGSWADTTISVPKRPSRLSEQNTSRRWNPHLSVVHSVSTEEGSNEHPLPVQEGEPSSVTSSMVVENPSETSSPLAPPRPLFPRNRDGTGSTIRVVDDDDDKTTKPQSRPLRSQGSGFLSVLSSGSVKRKIQKPSEVRTEPGSRGSFLRDSIPAWARIHYARSQDALPGAPGSSTEDTGSPSQNVSPVSNNFPVGIYRPRNRPHQNDIARRASMGITPAPQDPQVVEVRGPPRRRVTEIWSPRLQHDKRPVKRSVWKAPSLDEKAERSLLSRRNVQIIMFTVGFILPFAWMVASFLPLPPRPVVSGEKPTSRSDAEQAMEQSLGPIDEARYQNARWWRYVNRVMSIVGILILATIIALAVVAARMRDS